MQAFFVFLLWTFMGHILGYEGFDTLREKGKYGMNHLVAGQ